MESPATDLPSLILASSSPYRRNLLRRLALDFETISPEVDETPQPGEPPAELAQRLSIEKAQEVAAQAPQALVIGSDQVAAVDGQLLEKPLTVHRACEQLRLSSGNNVRFYTGVALLRGNDILDLRRVDTVVAFRKLSDTQIRSYVERENPLDCAGSFRWERLGICLFKSLTSSDPTALEGLPLIALCEMLESAGLSII